NPQDLRSRAANQAAESDIAIAHFHVLPRGLGITGRIPALNRSDRLPQQTAPPMFLEEILCVLDGQFIAVATLRVGRGHDEVIDRNAVIEPKARVIIKDL